MPYDYIKSPDDIYRQSFALVGQALAGYDLPEDMLPLAKRLVHTCGDPSIAQDLAWSPGFVDAGLHGLSRALLVDVEMVAAGITARFLPAGVQPVCHLNRPEVAELAQRLGTTRSAAALQLWGDALEGALVAFGNAPTALFHLLEGIEAGRLPRPAAVIAMPVGFVGAAESKAAIAASDLPFITVHGTRGGSAMAASVVNALALIARQESQE